jgi:hypothetical protein
MYKNYVPRLAEIKIGFNMVTVVHKDKDGFWVVRQPFALYPTRYSEWKTAIEFAFGVGTVYTGSDTDNLSPVASVMINRRNVRTHRTPGSI